MTTSENRPVAFADDNPVLLCPRCRSSYLHHTRVTIYEREKEDAASHAVIIEGTKISRFPNADGNPSARRNGLAIRFWCEECGAVSSLELAQHKGQTLVDWRRAAEPSTPNELPGHVSDVRPAGSSA